MVYHSLTRYPERAREIWRYGGARERARKEIWSYLDNLMTDKQTNGMTELFLKSLSQLKTSLKGLTGTMPKIEKPERD